MAKKTQLEQEWFSIKQTAAYLQLNQQSIRRLIRDGKLDARQIIEKGKILISKSSIEAILEASRIKTES
jgi:excisionase family DNA binding protein